MDNDTKKFLSDLLAELQRIDYVRPEDIPNIDLYMDQITTFMDSQLEASKACGWQDSDQDDDQQLRQEQSSPSAGEEKVHQRARTDADFHLLF